MKRKKAVRFPGFDGTRQKSYSAMKVCCFSRRLQALWSELPCRVLEVGLPKAMKSGSGPGRAAEAGLWPGRAGDMTHA